MTEKTGIDRIVEAMCRECDYHTQKLIRPELCGECWRVKSIRKGVAEEKVKVLRDYIDKGSLETKRTTTHEQVHFYTQISKEAGV